MSEGKRFHAVLLVGASLLLPAGAILMLRSAHATPSYSRRFDTACATCHAPLPPRLNNVGMLFHRAGFRLPDADENGKLILKAQPAHDIMEATSISASLEARNDSQADPGTSRSTMGVREVELVGGTSIGDCLSAQYMFLPRNEDGEAELEDVEVQANVGPAAQQLVVRAGQIQTFLWQKANHGSLTPSMPMILDEGPMAPVGNFAGFALGAKQTGVEAGYTYTQLNRGKVLATMLSAAVLNGVTEAGTAAARNPTDGVDVLLQAYELVGSRNNLGVFYYKGRTVVDAEGLLMPPGPFRDRFDRAGAIGTVSPVDWLEVTGGAVLGKDRSEQLARDVSTRGGYVEATGSYRHYTATYRWEQLNPDADTQGDLMRADVLATSCQAWEHLLLSAEYRQLTASGMKSHTVVGVLRLVY